jgi:hypothetical protein
MKCMEILNFLNYNLNFFEIFQTLLSKFESYSIILHFFFNIRHPKNFENIEKCKNEIMKFFKVYAILKINKWWNSYEIR